jgi:hypothetical protein
MNQTLVPEDEALAYAREQVAWFRENPIGLCGENVLMIAPDGNHRFKVNRTKDYALQHP